MHDTPHGAWLALVPPEILEKIPALAPLQDRLARSGRLSSCRWRSTPPASHRWTAPGNFGRCSGGCSATARGFGSCPSGPALGREAGAAVCQPACNRITALALDAAAGCSLTPSSLIRIACFGATLRQLALLDTSRVPHSAASALLQSLPLLEMGDIQFSKHSTFMLCQKTVCSNSLLKHGLQRACRLYGDQYMWRAPQSLRSPVLHSCDVRGRIATLAAADASQPSASILTTHGFRRMHMHWQ